MQDPNYALKNSILLDSGSNTNIFNITHRDRFTSFSPAYDLLVAGETTTTIEGWGTALVPLSNGTTITLNEVAYCPNMATSLVSALRLRQQGVFFDTEHMHLRDSNGTVLHQFADQFDQFVLEYHPIRSAFSAHQSRATRPPSTAEGMLWHLRLGHAGTQALEHLETSSRNAKIHGPKTVECHACGLAKPRETISRVPPDRPPAYPFSEVAVDLHPMEPNDRFTRYMLITCRDSGYVYAYFMPNDKHEHILRALHDAYNLILTQFKIKIRVIKCDQEIGRSLAVRDWARDRGIIFETSAPYTQE